MNTNRLALGTVQFGMPYGIANKTGQTSLKEASSILSHASQLGINTLDTAIGYGESETILGSIGVNSWDVISKLPSYEAQDKSIEKWIYSSLDSSTQRLKVDKLYGILLHQATDLQKPFGKDLYKTLVSLKENKRVEKIGVSIYNISDLEWLNSSYDFDIIQAPFSVFDQELKEGDYLKILKSRGTEVHVRSIFLQGLLLMEPHNRPTIFSRWDDHFSRWDNFIKERALIRLEACLSFAFSHSEIDRIVVGVDSLIQLKEIITALNNITPLSFPDNLRCKDTILTKPSHWNAL